MCVVYPNSTFPRAKFVTHLKIYTKGGVCELLLQSIIFNRLACEVS